MSSAADAPMSSLHVYADRRMLAILAMGFASGLPLLLTTTTLSYWLSTRGVDKTSIGYFAAVGLPYALKFLWAPAIDLVQVPLLSRVLGQRRAWTLLSQSALVGSILALAEADPATAPLRTALLVLGVAFCSATQDIAVDAYRIEILATHEQGAGAAATQIGYRGGLLVAGAGVIALSDFLAWATIFRLLAMMVAVGALGVLIAREPDHPVGVRARVEPMSPLAPLRDLLARRQAFALIAFALLYKFGDAIAGTMSMPFFHEVGFTGVEIASVTKVFGVLANLSGVLVGGLLVARIGLLPSLFAGGILQAITNLLFAWQAQVGHDLTTLMVAIGADGFTGGLASAAFVAFLSSLCRTGMSGTQYALLTSLMAFGRTAMAAGSGWLADQLAWGAFFGVTTLLALPGLLLLAWLWRHGFERPDPLAQI